MMPRLPGPTYAAVVAEPLRCVPEKFSDEELDAWLDVTSLDKDVELALTGKDIYFAHTALRHLESIDQRHHTVKVVLPMALRTNPGFTPWLADAKTLKRDEEVIWDGKSRKVCVLICTTKAKHAHVAAAHCATFDIRANGAAVRSLWDSGANCCCLSKAFATRVGLTWEEVKNKPDDTIGGVGGAVSVLGKVTAPVKIGKLHIQQEFVIVEDSIAGYDCLLGEDFFTTNYVSIAYEPNRVSVTVGRDAQGGHRAKLSRTIQDSVPSKVQYGNDTAGKYAFPMVMSIAEESEEREPCSRKEQRALYRDVRNERAVAYRVMITPRQTASNIGVDEDYVIPEGIREVIKKHSGPGGTLCGSIPANTHAKGYECKIDIEPGNNPVHIRQYRLTPLEKAELMKQIDAFLAKGWIELSSSSWCSSVLFVPKPNNKLRFCVDYRHLNARTVQDRGNIPLQGELLDELQGATVFSALDLASGYYQLAVEPDSRKYTAFPTPYGLYQWCVMPMGLCNAPAIFQRAMNQILHEHIKNKYCLVYLDDIIIMSKSVEEHIRHVDAVLTSLNEHNLFCQLPKCFWAREELKYLGHIVTGKGVKPDPAKVATLDSWTPPIDVVEKLKEPDCSKSAATSYRKSIVHECRRFLGFMNYFNRYIPRYSELAGCLHEQTKDIAPEWSIDCTVAWDAMKKLLREATMMYHPVMDLPFHVYSDASIRAIGGVLMQLHEGLMKPVAFCARKLSPAEVNYTTTEQEMLGMVYCFQQWRCYLETVSTPVFLHTDHEPLTWLASQARPNRRQARWLEFLSQFQYELLYVKGDENVVADALTRTLQLPEGPAQDLPCEHWPKEIAAFCRRPDTGGISAHAGAGTAPSGMRTAPDWPADPLAGNRCRSDLPQRHVGGTEKQADTARGTNPPAHRRAPCILTIGWAAIGGYTRGRHAREQQSTRSVDGGEDSSQAGVNPNRSHQGAQGDAVRTPPHRDDRNTRISGNPHSDSTANDQLSKPCKNTERIPAQGQGSAKKRKRAKVSFTGIADSEEFPGRDATSKIPTEAGSADDKVEDISCGSARTDPDQTSTELRPVYKGSDPSLSKYELLYEELFNRMRELIVRDTATQTEKQQQELQLAMRDGLLWRKGFHQLYVPNDTMLKQDLLYWHHDVPWCIHLGIEKTLELVKRSFWWPGMDTDIKEYIASCRQCQAHKPDRRISRPPLTPLLSPDACWRTLGVDLIVDLPVTTDEGYNAIIVFVCHLSGMVRLVPTYKDVSTRGTAKLFFREIFPHYGMPNKIVSDRGSTWNSEFFKELCDFAGIKLHMSTAYHPQTNGLVERSNEVVEAALRHYVSADHRDWNDHLPFIEFGMNNMYKKSRGTSAFQMNRITLPLNPFEAVVGNIRENETGVGTGDVRDNNSVKNSQLSSWMGMSTVSGARTVMDAQERFSWARRCIHLAKSRMKDTHDKKGTTTHLYQVGEMVWFNMRNLSLKHPSLRHKLVPRYMGPLKVIEVIGRSAIKLDFPQSLGIHPTVSISLCKPFLARSGVDLPPVNIDGQEEWEVETLLDHHLIKSKRKKLTEIEFKVRWKGSYEDTWQVFHDFEHAMQAMEAYILSRTRKVRKEIFKALSDEELGWLSLDLRNEAQKD